MLELDEITAMESRGWGSRDLQPAYDALLERWHVTQDRETGLRLLFLAWYATAEPELHTGLVDRDARAVAADMAISLDDTLSDDPEFLFVAVHMMSLCPWAFDGRERTWARRERAYRAAAERLGANTLSLESFSGRGAYGLYFAGIWASHHLDEDSV
jgi:hypothetical protein